MANYATQQTTGRGPAGGVGSSRQKVTSYAEYTTTGALATNDYIEMVRVPAGAIITGVTLKATDLDTNGTPTITLSVGDSASANRFISASTIAQAGGFTETMASGTGAMFYHYTSETNIRVTAAAGAATGAAGTISLMVEYLIDPMKS